MSGNMKQNRFWILCVVLFCAVLLLVSAAAAVPLSSQASITITGVYNGVPPFAAFTATPLSGIAPLTVAFDSSASTGTAPLTYAWNFGDGGTSTLPKPSHEYTAAGSYPVTLTVSNKAGISTTTPPTTITVTAPPVPLKADFTATQTTCSCKWNVTFNDISTGTYTSRAWAYQKVGTTTWTTFGSGLPTPNLSFSTSAPYYINLTVTNAAGNSNTLIKTITPGPLKASFTASTTSGPRPLTVTFTDTSTGVPTSWKWEVKTGSGSYSQVSTDQNPSLDFNTPGTYYVQLTTTSSCGSSTSSPFIVYDPLSITGIMPTSGNRGWPVGIALTGTGFQPKAKVKLTRGSSEYITGNDVTVVSPEQITCTFDLKEKTADTWNVVVTNPDGQVYTLTKGFEITAPAPTVSSITPASGNRGWPISIAELKGTGFQPKASVNLTRTGSSDVITATNVKVVSLEQITCTFDLTGKTPGKWNVTATNPDGKVYTLTNGFEITSPAPAVSSIAPSDGLNTKTVSITNLAGSNFQPGATVKLNRTGSPDITATSVTVKSATQITCTFDLTGKTPGPWDVVVTNTDGLYGTLIGGFNVRLPAPTVTARSNATIYRGWMGYELITGTNFVSGAQSVINTTTGNSISSTSCNFKSSTQMFCSYNLLGAPISTAYRVAVINPDGQSGLMTKYTVSVASPAPTVTTSAPATGVRGTSVSITNLVGTRFQPGAVVDYYLSGTRINLTGVNVVSATQITGTLNIPLSAPAGSYGVSVKNTDGITGVSTGRFTITNPPPTVTTISPIQGRDGMLVSPVIVTGTNFLKGAQVRLYRGSTLIYTAPVGTVDSTTQITTSFTIPETVVVGVTDVRVTNTDALYGTLSTGYTILE